MSDFDVIREAQTEALNLIARYNRDPRGISYEGEHVRVMNMLRDTGPALERVETELAEAKQERDLLRSGAELYFKEALAVFRSRAEAAEARVADVETRLWQTAHDYEAAEARVKELEAELAVLREGIKRQKRGADNAAFYAEAAEAALADMTAQRDALLAEAEAERCPIPPSDWEPAKAEWHQFHLDQTAAQRARAEAAEAEAAKLREALEQIASAEWDGVDIHYGFSVAHGMRDIAREALKAGS